MSSVKNLQLWVLLILIFTIAWMVLTPTRGGVETTWSVSPAAIALIAASIAVVLGFKRLVAVARAHNQAITDADALSAEGRYDEAVERVQGLGRSRLPQFRRIFPAWLASLEIVRGDARAAVPLATQAIEQPIGRLFRDSQRSTVNVAHGLRAFARASVGDAAGAREDIAHLRALPNAEVTLLASASIAEARLLDELGDRAALADVLARDRVLLLDATIGWDRALVRAYEAMLDASAASVYRRKADDVWLDEPARKAAAWIAKIAPNAAPFVRPSVPAGTGDDVDPETPSEAARRKVLDAKPLAKGKKQHSAWGVLWVVGMLAFLYVWGVLATTPWPAASQAALAMGTAAIVALLVGPRWRRTKRDERRVAEAQRNMTRSVFPRSAEDVGLEVPTRAQRAQIANVLAEGALYRGDAAGALALVDEGFSALAPPEGGRVPRPANPPAGKPVPWDVTRALATQRARALAALGRADEAWAEIEWANGLPEHDPTVFRVHLVTRLHASDFEGAARAVEGRDAKMSLATRDETLAEIARFLGRPAARTPGSARRLRAELRRDVGLAPWIEGTAPGAMARFEVLAAETASADEPFAHA